MHLKSSCTPTRSLPSRGVPGIGTRALTGNDSGASGSLQSLSVLQRREVGRNALAHLPNQTDAVSILFAETNDTTTADADACIANSGKRVETVVVVAGGDDLEEEGREGSARIRCSEMEGFGKSEAHLGVELSRSVKVVVVRC